MNDLAQLIHDIENEARAEGPEAVAELAAFDARFALASDLIARRKATNLTQKDLLDATDAPVRDQPDRTGQTNRPR